MSKEMITQVEYFESAKDKYIAGFDYLNGDMSDFMARNSPLTVIDIKYGESVETFDVGEPERYAYAFLTYEKEYEFDD